MARTALIVEDPTRAGTDLADLLEDRFDTIRTVGSATEAVEVAIQLRPDLVITPFPAVTRSGKLLVTALKQDPRTTASKVLAYTDWNWANTRAKALEAGCEAFVACCAPAEELLAAVDRLVGQPEPIAQRPHSPRAAEPVGVPRRGNRSGQRI